MTRRAIQTGLILASAAGALLLAAGASAQDGGSATTRSLNAAPPQSVLTPRANVQPPLSQAERPPVKPKPQPQQAPPSRTLEDLLADTQGIDDEDAQDEGVTLAEGQTEPDPIALTLGYYVRGDKDCEQVWPGDGDLAFATPTSFTIDYGGCEPGQWQQTGPNSWREDQRCQTELGGDAGGYSVAYEVVDTATLNRTARLAIDDSVERDAWHHCRLQDVPENARFADGTADDATETTAGG